MKNKHKLKLFFTALILPLLRTYCFNFNVVVDQLPVGSKNSYIVNSTTEFIVEVLNLTNSITEVPPRISVKCEECQENHPLLIVVRQNKGVLSWELPVVLESENAHSVYKKTERTLCPYDILNSSSNSNFYFNLENYDMQDKTEHFVTISLTTSSNKNVNVELEVNLQQNFVLFLQEKQEVVVTPSSPFLFLFKFSEENISSILLHITSNDNTCMIVSIQNVSCPVFDLEQNVQYKGHFQTITEQGGFTLTVSANLTQKYLKKEFPVGFYVILMVSGKDAYCSSVIMTDQVERSKTVELLVTKSISSVDYRNAILITFIPIVLFCISMFSVYYHKYRREKCIGPDDLEFLIDAEHDAATSSIHHSSVATVPSTPGLSRADTDALSVKTDSSLDETDYDFAHDAEFDKDIFRLKGYLYVIDLARKNQIVFKKQSSMYFWNLLTVAIFYFLPVIQLVVTNQIQFQESSKEDLCYYNFLCSNPLWFFSDFNHVFSNIGYFFFGSLFMMLTAMKEKLYNIKILSNKTLYRFYGIPQHFGLFYAMGAALIIEGILSASYHLCPNRYNFQFDTTFMYVISTLCMIKIYQTRHPDVNASAYETFFLLAGVVFIGMCGIFSYNFTFRILFTILHLSTCLNLSLQIYYMGRWKFDYTIFIRFFKELQVCFNCSCRYFIPIFPSRFFLLVIANGFNWAIAIGNFFFDIQNFSSYLLAIFMVNLMLYTTFYIIMKIICKERLMLQSVIYIFLSILGWSLSLYFFFNKTTSWKLTPAESKLYNHPCQLLGFYDNHDIWHFTSAFAMFFSFMVLLTLDDDLVHVHRSKIYVF